MVAEEALGASRTIRSYLLHVWMGERYLQQLKRTERLGLKTSRVVAALRFLIEFLNYATWGLCLWYGAWLVRSNVYNSYTQTAYTGEAVLSVFTAVLMGAMSLGPLKHMHFLLEFSTLSNLTLTP